MFKVDGPVPVMKVVVLIIVAIQVVAGLFFIGIPASEAQSLRHAAIDKYVRAHRCVVAYEERSYARLYQCGTGDNVKYITPSELRKAADIEAVQGPKG